MGLVLTVRRWQREVSCIPSLLPLESVGKPYDRVETFLLFRLLKMDKKELPFPAKRKSLSNCK